MADNKKLSNSKNAAKKSKLKKQNTKTVAKPKTKKNLKASSAKTTSKTKDSAVKTKTQKKTALKNSTSGKSAKKIKNVPAKSQSKLKASVEKTEAKKINNKNKKNKTIKASSAKIKNKTAKASEVNNASNSEKIVIDAEKNLVFESENELFAYFAEALAQVEKEFDQVHTNKNDISTAEYDKYEKYLVELLSSPDQIWQDDTKLPGIPLKVFVRRFDIDDEKIYYVGLVYMAVDTPTFVFLHFPSTDESMVDYYRKGDLVYDREMSEQAEGDALGAGDELAVGLHQAMLKIRSDKDIPEADFVSFIDFREDTIQEPDEIWRTADLNGNILVNFIKDYSEGEEILYYIAIAKEDKGSDTHYLLFAFPTNDKNLVERYRQGENLQSEESAAGESH